MGTLRPINPHTASLIANPQAAAHDYDNLTHKPQINGHELSGDQSGSDLGLQNQLTAGDNVTIDESGVISAEGGTDDYNALKNKPSINNVELDGNKTAENLGLQSTIDNYFTSDNNSYLTYDFNHIPIAYNSKNSCMYRLPLRNILNFPQDLADVFSSGSNIYIFHYINSQYGANYLIRKIAGYSVNNQYIEFAQFCTVIEGGSLVNVSPWQELTGGGSQIVSGVVNANGTITFTDSDGNSFTTSGSSVIGADGFSPTATVTQTQSGATVSITDKNGTTTANISNGADGQDYVLTSQDKTDIANIVLGELPTTQGVLYGNTSN